MQAFLSTAIALLSLASLARAQAPLLREDFESGAPAWTFSGLWHVEADSTTCGAQTAPFPSGGHSAWWGSSAFGCNYAGGPSGPSSLELTTVVQLPANADSIALRYRRYLATEGCQGGFDLSKVRIRNATGSATHDLLSDCASEPGWSDRRFDLTTEAGNGIRLSFEFDAVDGNFNSTLGWWIDDIEVVVEPGLVACTATPACPCPSQSFGTSNPHGPNPNEDTGGCRHSSGKEARLFGNGAQSVAADTVELVVHDLPQSTSIIYVQGLTPQSVVFGDGKRCFGGTAVRLAVRGVTGGEDTYPHAGETGVALKGAVPPAGGSRSYQVVYRDAATYCTSSTFNTSNAYVIAWLP